MALHKKKFTFDDPEDSYWNESGSNSSSLFDDLPSKQWAARTAMDNLFDQNLTENGITKTVNLAASGDAAIKLTNEPTQLREKIMDEFISKKNTSYKMDNVASPHRMATGPSAPSIVSECSASSLPSDANRLDLDYSRLRAEHRKLQRHLETVRHDRFRALDVKEAVRHMLKGDPVSLDLYRSKKDKMQLLDAAIDIVDGNVIQTVVLFLKRTLADSIFRDILLRKREAAEEYIAYLKQTKDYEELTTTLFALGRNADAAMIEFSAAIRHQVIDQKIQALKKCSHSGFSDPQLSTENSLVNDYINLLERQIPIDNADDQSRADIFKQLPKNARLVGQSAIATFYYCCLYHYDSQTNSLACPGRMREVLRLSEKEFVWISVSALVRLSRWPDIERVLQPKSILGALQSRGILNSKLSCPFSWQNLFYIMHSNAVQPPKDIVIECLVAQRDRLKLLAYSSKLVPHTPEAYKSLSALSNTVCT
uniref:Vps16_C domain-containing protein n=1 Tax=Heterorhabditis bacteriophora TaxID=37862 RepID=A0A1I7XMD6_HETBA